MSSSNGPDRTPKAQEVMDYLATHELTQRLNDIVNNTVRVRADDPFAYMAQQFLAIARPPAISHVAISTVLDSTGHFTSLQADVFAWQPSTLVHMGRSIWQGAQECDNVDQMSNLMTNQLKSKPLKCDSVSELDKILSDLNEPNSSTIIPAASLALARAVAHATRQDLYLFLHKQSNPEKLPNAVVPLPLIDIVKSTKLTFGYFGVFLCSKDLPLRQFFRSCSSIAKYVKEHIDAKDNANSVDMDKADALLNLLDGGIKSIEQTPGDPISLWFDANASHMHIPETGEYDIGGGASVSRDELLAQYQTMLEQHKSLSIIIDPFHSSDLQGWERFAQVMGNRCVAISSGESVHGSPSSISFESTVSNYLATAGTLRSAGKDFVFSANNSQCDDALADLAVAVSAKYCRFGLMANGYKSSLYNRLLQIEETIKAKD